MTLSILHLKKLDDTPQSSDLLHDLEAEPLTTSEDISISCNAAVVDVAEDAPKVEEETKMEVLTTKVEVDEVNVVVESRIVVAGEIVEVEESTPEEEFKHPQTNTTKKHKTTNRIQYTQNKKIKRYTSTDGHKLI